MRRSFKFRLRPTVKQQLALTAMLADHRAIYNAALQERREAYRRARVTINYVSQSGQLKDIRAFDHDQARWSFSSQQATLRRLNLAFAAFFRRIKDGDRPGYPRFKGAAWFDTVVWPKDGDGCRWNSTPDDAATRVYLQGAGHIRVQQHRPHQGIVKTIAVKREGSSWYVVLSCDDVPAQPLPSTDRQAGLDVGVTVFAALSDGRMIENPRWGKASGCRLAEIQREHATRYPRHSPRSGRKTRSAQRVATLHRKTARRRADFHHKTALALVRDFDLIAHEKLNIAGMTRAPAPRPDGQGGWLPNGAGAKSGLNKSILDAGWGQFIGILTAKAESAGRLTVPVSPRNSSVTCHLCGHVDRDNRVSQALFRCQSCGHQANADTNAASNLLRAGLARVQGRNPGGSRPL